MNRKSDLRRFYIALEALEEKLGGRRRLSECHGRLAWPNRGVYFFFEDMELRTDSGNGDRVVRVGTHAIVASTQTRLWGRLRQHRGTAGGQGGNHRQSVFRSLVGSAIVARRKEVAVPTWGEKRVSRRGEFREAERHLEREVSNYIGAMPFLWIDADDEPSPRSIRAYIERNSIALLSNARQGAEKLDASSMGWLGRNCPCAKVIQSGLWNSNCVDKEYEPEFVDFFEEKVASM